MTTETLAKPLTKLAGQLNAHLATQAPERTLTLLDRCDRCIQTAQASFVFTLPPAAEGTGRTEADVLLCGHHTRQHLPALLALHPASYWIEPQELLGIRGVQIEAGKDTPSGDGLTGS